MLINVFGIWLAAANISYMAPSSSGCNIYFTNHLYRHEKPCNVLVEEIDRQTKLKLQNKQ